MLWGATVQVDLIRARQVWSGRAWKVNKAVDRNGSGTADVLAPPTLLLHRPSVLRLSVLQSYTC